MPVKVCKDVSMANKGNAYEVDVLSASRIRSIIRALSEMEKNYSAGTYPPDRTVVLLKELAGDLVNVAEDIRVLAKEN